MSHPSQSTLALHAGGDLGKFARWRVKRHLAQCDVCAAEVEAFAGLRLMTAELSEIPEIPWNRLAAEMKANIHLGLAAGECVRSEPALRDTRWFSGARIAVACAGIAALAVAGIILQRPQPALVFAQTPMVEATGNGIQLSAGGSAVGLMNRRGVTNVSYVPKAEGGMSASYVDPSTGGITVNTVYGQ